MVSGAGTWEVISHEDRALMNGFSVLIKRPEKAPLYLFLCVDTGRRTINESGSGPSPDTTCRTLTLDFPASRTVRNKFVVYATCLWYFWNSSPNRLRQMVKQKKKVCFENNFLMKIAKIKY